MKRIVLLLLCILPTIVMAETATKSTSPFDTLRKDRATIHIYYESLLIRKLGNDIGRAMSNRGFTPEQVQQVLTGPSFRRYSRRVVENPKVQASLDHFLNRLLAPGLLETMLEKKRAEFAAKQQASLALAIEELVRAEQRILPPQSKKSPSTFWQKIWRYLSKDLPL